MNFRFVSTLIFLTACGARSPGLSAVDVRADSKSDHEALRALTADELAGTIAYGENGGPFEYSGTPFYQALAFSGEVGDRVVARVTSSGRARAWLQDMQNDTLALASAESNGGTVELQATLALHGEYIIVWRELEVEEGAQVNVSLEGARDPLRDLPGVSCTGDLTDDGLVALFANPLDWSSYLTKWVRRIGSYKGGVYVRKCTSSSGCGSWKTSTDNLTVDGAMLRPHSRDTARHDIGVCSFQ